MVVETTNVIVKPVLFAMVIFRDIHLTEELNIHKIGIILISSMDLVRSKYSRQISFTEQQTVQMHVVLSCLKKRSLICYFILNDLTTFAKEYCTRASQAT